MHSRSLRSLDASHGPGILTEMAEDVGWNGYGGCKDIGPNDVLDAREAGGNQVYIRSGRIGAHSSGVCFHISESEFWLLIVSRSPLSCFHLLTPALLHSDMATKTEISAADAAFLIDGLQHVASTVVVCYPNLSLYISGSDQTLDQLWRDCGEEGLQRRVSRTTFLVYQESLQPQHPDDRGPL